MPDKSLSSNLLNMKFMKRGEQTAPAPKSETRVASSGGWSLPGAYRPKREFKNEQISISELEQPVPGRIRWKNGSKKQVLEEEEPEVPEVVPEPVKRKSEKQGKRKQKKRSLPPK